MDEYVSHLVPGIVQALAPEQQLNDVFAVDLLIVLEENSEWNVGCDHVLCQSNDRCFCVFVKLLDVGLFLWFTKQCLAVVAVEKAKHAFALRVEISAQLSFKIRSFHQPRIICKLFDDDEEAWLRPVVCDLDFHWLFARHLQDERQFANKFRLLRLNRLYRCMNRLVRGRERKWFFAVDLLHEWCGLDMLWMPDGCGVDNLKQWVGFGLPVVHRAPQEVVKEHVRGLGGVVHDARAEASLRNLVHLVSYTFAGFCLRWNADAVYRLACLRLGTQTYVPQVSGLCRQVFTLIKGSGLAADWVYVRRVVSW